MKLKLYQSISAVIAGTLLLFVSVTVFAQDQPLYLNPDALVEERVEDLLSRMTIEEKVGQMTQINVDMINLNADNYAYLDHEKARAAIRSYHIGSFLNGFAITPEEWYDFISNLQRINLEESRLGIPLLYGIDHMHGASYLRESTIFPQSLNISNTFDTEFARLGGKITAIESAPLGHNWNFAPVQDIGRDPRWPRLYETYGEDPLVSSRMGAAYVQGIQEDGIIGRYRVAATAKHFIGYSTPTSGWDRSPALIPDQNMHEFHRPPFQAVIDAGIKTVMVNSGEVNGVPVHASYDLLTTLLREEMGFDGVILTDWADIIKLTGYDEVGYQQEHYHRFAQSEKEATKHAILAGIDVSMTPMSYNFVNYMLELIEEGHISEARVDESVRRILRLKFELGLFENPMPTLEYRNLIGADEHRKAALNAARESIVLLENRNNFLPLTENPGTILLVGAKANSRLALNGGWTMEWQGGTEAHYPESMPTILQAMQAAFPEAQIEFADSIGSQGSTQRNRFNALARRADVIFAVVGEMPYTEFIGNITDLNIDPYESKLMRAVQGAERPHGFILVQGRPRVLPSDVISGADAVLFAGLPGFEGATAIAEIISGTVNPSGKLGFTYPRYPSHFNTYDHKPTDRATYMWPFGHGLSYTSFVYRDLKLSASNIQPGGSVTATVTISNNGDRAARYAALWFLTNDFGHITRPVRKLAHFDKQLIEAGASRTFQFEIIPEESLWHPDQNGNMILDPGRFILRIGNLEADLVLEKEEPAASVR